MNIDYNYAMKLIDSKSLTLDQEVKLLSEVKESLLNGKNSGRKIIKKIDGIKYHIAKKDYSKLYHVCMLLKQRENKVSSNNNIELKDKLEIKDSKLIYWMDKLKEKEDLVKKSPALLDQYKSLNNQLTDITLDSDTKIEMIKDFIDSNVITFNFLAGRKSQYKEKLEVVSDMEAKDLRGYDQIEEKPQKKKHKRSLSKIFKRIIAGLSALFMIGICSVLSHGNASKSNGETESYQEHKITSTQPMTKDSIKTNKKSTVSKTHMVKTVHRSVNKVKVSKLAHKKNIEITKNKIENTSSSKVQQTEPTTIQVTTQPTMSAKKSKVEVSEKKQSPKKTVTKLEINDNVRLGSKFKLKHDSLIYSNINNSNNEINGQKAYYNHNEVRDVVGLSIEHHNSNYTFIKVNDTHYKVTGNNVVTYLDEKSANKRIKKLIKKGGKVKSLLSGYNNTYEGYYNQKDAKILTK